MPARVETRWFRETAWRNASRILLLDRRPTFHRPDGSPGAGNSGYPCALVAYGRQATELLIASNLGGVILRAWDVV